jgi:Fe-S-cluster-containing hydrogenase component 2
MEKLIFIDHLKCVGCATCEMVCSLVHEEICSPALSRIRVVRYPTEAYNVPITCAFCESPPCVAVCPTGAIEKNLDTGDVAIDFALCIGCRQCVQACPFGHMNFSFARGTAFKCDLCGGNPQCVEFCWTEALQYVPLERALGDKRQAAARNILQHG